MLTEPRFKLPGDSASGQTAIKSRMISCRRYGLRLLHPDRRSYRDGKLIVKWDLENRKAMKGAATKRALDLIAQLEAEGLL